VATQAASHLVIAEINGESARRHLAAYLLNAVALFVLDRTLSSGDIDATQLADAARQLVRGRHHGRGSEALRGREAVIGQAGSRRGRAAGCPDVKLSAASR
jgi:hypothetical protein